MNAKDTLGVCCSWLLPTVSQTCLHTCSVKTYHCAGHPSHRAPSIDGVSIDISMQPNPSQDRLLQRCASWCTDWQNTKTAASPDQRSSDCAPGVEELPCRAAAAPAALDASSAADHIQVDSSDIKVRSTSAPSYLRNRIMECVYHQLYVRRSPHCRSSRSPVKTSSDVLAGFQRRLSGTRCHIQFSSAFDSRLKTFYVPGFH